MRAPESQIIVGVDGCRKGWLCFELERLSKAISVKVEPSFETVLHTHLGRAKIIATDIPIGLPAAGGRKCDLTARKLLGKPRSNSVFPPPIRPALQACTYPGACGISCAAHGKGLSRQTFAILPKIREVDRVMTPQLQKLVFEVHPELCFWKLNDGYSMQHRKSSMEGRKERLELLAPQYPIIGKLLAGLSRKEAAPDDLLDAAAAAWTGERLADGVACGVIQSEEVDENGLLMNMFY